MDIHVNHDPNRHIVKGYRRKATKQGILRVDDLFGINGHEPTETRGGIPYDPSVNFACSTDVCCGGLLATAHGSVLPD